jgi:broad-specificity NMP kinase
MTTQNDLINTKNIEEHNPAADNQVDINTSPQKKEKWHQPHIIELVGPPGSGKTTVTEILKTKNKDVRVEIFPFINNRKDLPFFTLNLLRLFPDLFRFFLHAKGKDLPTKRDIAIMTILTGWDLVLKKMTSSNKQMVVLEEGAICLLAKLYGFGSDIFQEPCAKEWWQKAYGKWAHTLDMVIVLDTPIDILLKRIRSRELQYEIKGMFDEDATKYLDRIHKSEIHAMSCMKEGPSVFHIQTQGKGPDQIADEINSILCFGS